MHKQHDQQSTLLHDLLTETPIPLSDAPSHIPLGPGRRRVHIATIYRWTHRGIHGHRLEAVRIGGRWMTSVEALSRFFARLTHHVTLPGTTSTTAGTHQSYLEAVDQELDKEGL